MNVQCARDQLVFGPGVHKRNEDPTPQEGGWVLCPIFFVSVSSYTIMEGPALAPPPTHPPVSLPTPCSMNPHTYKAMDEEENSAVLSSKTESLSKTAVTQND